jgi:poly(A) polymerase
LEKLCFSLFDAYFHQSERYVSVTPLLDGDDLIRIFHLNPGPLFKDILAQLSEAQAVGEVRTRPEAEHFVQQLLS